MTNESYFGLCAKSGNVVTVNETACASNNQPDSDIQYKNNLECKSHFSLQSILESNTILKAESTAAVNKTYNNYFFNGVESDIRLKILHQYLPFAITVVESKLPKENRLPFGNYIKEIEQIITALLELTFKEISVALQRKAFPLKTEPNVNNRSICVSNTKDTKVKSYDVEQKNKYQTNNDSNETIH